MTAPGRAIAETVERGSRKWAMTLFGRARSMILIHSRGVDIGLSRARLGRPGAEFEEGPVLGGEARPESAVDPGSSHDPEPGLSTSSPSSPSICSLSLNKPLSTGALFANRPTASVPESTTYPAPFLSPATTPLAAKPPYSAAEESIAAEAAVADMAREVDVEDCAWLFPNPRGAERFDVTRRRELVGEVTKVPWDEGPREGGSSGVAYASRREERAYGR